MGFPDAPLEPPDAPPDQQEYNGHQCPVGKIDAFTEELLCRAIRKYGDNIEQVIADGDNRNALDRFLQHQLLPCARFH